MLVDSGVAHPRHQIRGRGTTRPAAGGGHPAECGRRVRELSSCSGGHALTRILVALAWGFFVLASTIPPKWWEVGPFETLERCEEIRAGLRLAGAMIEIDECVQW